jgi:mRNA interferase RelE/StbE
MMRGLPPEIKRALRARIRTLAENPAAGEPLRGELRGRFKCRVRTYRIVYEIDRRARLIRILAVGHRRSVYEELTEALRRK